MKKNKLSIIIPVYNAEKYITTCITSVLENFHGSEEELEIIAVDDGSSDSSLYILQELKVQSKGMLQVIHQQNGGVSKARNTGIANASGTYITFLDADDIIMNDGIDEILEKMAETEESDFIVFDYCDIDEKGAKIASVDVTSALADRKAIDEAYIMGHYFNTCWGKAYRLSKIKEAGIKFPVGMKVGEDVKYVGEVLPLLTGFQCIQKELYGYRQFQESTMITTRSVLNEKNIQDISSVLQCKEEYARLSGWLEKHAVSFYEKYAEVISSNVHFVLKNSIPLQEKKDSIGEFLQCEQVKHILQSAIKCTGIGKKRQMVSRIYCNPFFRNRYIEIYHRKYKG